MAALISLFSLVLGSFPRVMKRKEFKMEVNSMNGGTEMATTQETRVKEHLSNRKEERLAGTFLS